MNETIPAFEIVPYGFEFENERRKMHSAPHAPYAPHWPHWPPWRKRRDLGPRTTLLGPPDAPEPDGSENWPAPPSSPLGSEYVRWVQATLRRALGVPIRIDGVMTRALRNRIRTFQRHHRLPVSGYIGPDTDGALRRAGYGPKHFEGRFELEYELKDAASVAEAALARANAVPLDAALRTLGMTPAVGLYRFYDSSGRFYTGASGGLRARILQHAWCLSHLGRSTGGYRVALHLLPGASAVQLRDLERQINLHHRDNHMRLNRNTELEFLKLNEI